MNASISNRQFPPAGRLGGVFDALRAQGRAGVASLDAGEVRQLEALGVRIANGEARIGDDVELLSADAVRAHLDAAADAWLREIEMRAHIDSTNTALIARAARERIDGCVLAAEVQTGGRGRRGRVWLSPFGRHLAVSIGVRVDRPAGSAGLGALSLVAGLAVRRALVAIGVADAMLKWPNDVLLGGRKLAGILIELARGGDEAVIGVGINIDCRRAIAERVDQAVADVAERVARPSRNRLLAMLLNALAAYRGAFGRRGFAPLQAEWEQAHAYQGTIATVSAPGHSEAETVSGTVLGVNAEGALRLRTETGVRELIAGELSLRSGAGA